MLFQGVEIGKHCSVGMARKVQKKADKRLAKKDAKRAATFESRRYSKASQKKSAMEE
jgi:hypothetical protein